MRLIEIFKFIALETGVDVPKTVIGSQDRDHMEIIHLTQMTCEEITRRVDWPVLRREAVFIGDGVLTIFKMPIDFLKLRDEPAVTGPSGLLRGGLTDSEWKSLPPGFGPEPRYYRNLDRQIEIWPALAPGVTVRVDYQSANWNGTGAAWTADDNEPLIDANLIIKGAIWRFRRAKGLDYAGQQAEFESVLSDLAKFSSAERSP